MEEKDLPPKPWAVIASASFWVSPSPATGGVILTLAHPSGWVHYLFEPSGIAQVTQLMAQQSAPIPPPPAATVQ